MATCFFLEDLRIFLFHLRKKGNNVMNRIETDNSLVDVIQLIELFFFLLLVPFVSVHVHVMKLYFFWVKSFSENG